MDYDGMIVFCCIMPDACIPLLDVRLLSSEAGSLTTLRNMFHSWILVSHLLPSSTTTIHNATNSRSIRRSEPDSKIWNYSHKLLRNIRRSF